MPPTVHLRDVVGEMEGFDDNFRSFLNRATGELATVGVEDLSAVEDGYDLETYPQWQREAIQKAEEIMVSDDWLELPSKFEIHEWEIMRRFCYSLDDERLSSELLDAIHGSGAFRAFENTIYYRGIEERWYSYRQDALEQIARDWLERNEIPFVED
jgi:hypothetical protein